MSALLPKEFAELEPFAAGWCLASEPERYTRRLASSMPELQAFYDALAPRAEAVMKYLDRYALDDLPPEALNLMYLMYSLVTVSFAVECWRAPRVPDSGAARIDCVAAPVP
jgi:hypothetical protein